MPKKPNYLITNLPTELVDDILVQSPVKPLLRFRSVCKRWLALIDSPDFIKSHLNRSIETRNNRSLVVNSYPCHYWLNVGSHGVPFEIDHPLKTSHENNPGVMGSCNGLVLLRYYADVGGCDDMIIWNPFARNYHELPFSAFNSIGDDCVLFGIGYESVHDDYKVLKIILFYRDIYYDDQATIVMVYSLKSNTWRRIHDFPYDIWNDWSDGVFSSGALHWVVHEKNYYDPPDYISAFDLATEEYRLLAMPNIIGKKYPKYDANLFVMEGCLCVTCQHYAESMDVWVTKSYGVRESWTKLISFDPWKLVSLGGRITYKFDYIKPLVFSIDGKEAVLMQKANNLIWFDLESKVEKMVDAGVSPTPSPVEVVVQSLVPLGNGSETRA